MTPHEKRARCIHEQKVETQKELHQHHTQKMVWRKELCHSVNFNKISVLKTLLKRSDIRCGLENLTRWDSKAGGAPLHWAALSGRTEMMERILDAGARVNCYRVGDEAKPFRLTALHDAIHAGQTDSVKLLLERGANPLLVGHWGNYAGSCLDWAEQKEKDNGILHILNEAKGNL